ncbi:MAG TPA: hypothetical protein VGF55_15945 [Gemmataceae bacterium]|jgi:hypothetical protein
MRPGHPFRTLARRLGFRSRRTVRHPGRTRLAVTALEDRTVPDGTTPFRVDRPTGPHYFCAAGADAQGNSVIVYQGFADNGTYDIYFQRVDADGTPVGDPGLANTPSDGDHVLPALAVAPDGRFVVAWEGDGPGGDGTCDLWARRFDADGTPVGPEFAVGRFEETYWGWCPAAAIAPDGTFAVASADQMGWGAPPQAYARLFSWDLQASTPDIPLGAELADPAGTQAARVSLSDAGTLVATYMVYAEDSPDPPRVYAQQFAYTPDAGGGFQVAAVTAPLLLAGARAVPVAAPDGGFAVVVETDASGTGGIGVQHFAADGTPVEAAPVPVVAAGDMVWVDGAGMDGGGNVYVAWGDQPAVWNGGSWDLYAVGVAPDGALLTDPVRLTPQSPAFDSVEQAAVAVGGDGSLTAGWTSYGSDTGYGVTARHYDPIVYTKTETDALTSFYSLAQAEVTSTATVFADHVLWEYRIKNTGAYVSLRSFEPGNPGGLATAESHPSGWTWYGYFWSISDTNAALLPGQEAYFSYTTSQFPIGRTWSSTSSEFYPFDRGATGLVLGPGPGWLTATLNPYIPINANNDNYRPAMPNPPPGHADWVNENHPRWASVWTDNANIGPGWITQPGIPDIRDFDVRNLWQPDPELIPLTINWSGNGGRIAVTSVSTGAGRLSFWEDRQKQSRFTGINV